MSGWDLNDNHALFSVRNRLEKNTGISNYLKNRADRTRSYISFFLEYATKILNSPMDRLGAGSNSKFNNTFLMTSV